MEPSAPPAAHGRQDEDDQRQRPAHDEQRIHTASLSPSSHGAGRPERNRIGTIVTFPDVDERAAFEAETRRLE
jgi:hypothetical protein